MKALKTLVAIALSATGLGSAVAIGVAAGNQTVEPSQAATATTVYYAISSTEVGSYTVKCNVNRQGDASNWASYTMSKDGTKTYNGKTIYKATFTDLYDGLGALQFQLYDGDTWKSQVQPIDGWTSASTYNGKLWEKGGSTWNQYAYDVTRTVYLDTYDWSSLLVHIWDAGSANTSWPGNSVSFTDPNLRFNGENSKLQAYTVTGLNTAKFLYQSAADTNKSSDFNLTDGAYYWHNGSNWVQETGDIASAAKYVWDFNTARLAVTASGSVKDYSICGLNLSSWYSKYSSLTSGAKTYVNAASILTYKDSSSSSADTRVSFAEIVEYMSEANGLGSRQIIPSSNDDKFRIIVVLLISTTLISATGAYFILRKKRKHQ